MVGLEIEKFKKLNEKKHKTFMYENVDLVLRRGLSFKMNLKFQEKIKKQAIFCELRTTKDPSIKAGTLIKLRAEDEVLSTEIWDMVIKTDDDFNFDIEIMISSNAPIGKYKVDICVRLDSQIARYPSFPAFIIANPFDEFGGCFFSNNYKKMKTDEFLSEYVFEDEGQIFTSGGGAGPSSMTWVFGQFESNFLPVVCDLLDRYEGAFVQNNLTSIVRALSAMANAKGDKGVLECKWGDREGFKDGKFPYEWSDSYQIIDQYFQTGKPVKYGQCWVMSGLLTAMIRCLGIPCRSVTCLDAAYDMDNTLTVDHYFDIETYEDCGSDFVWNFHVWCDVWLNRLDLPQGSDGWNCVDGCPVITRAGIQQCGPAPLTAIKDGNVYLQHDAAFMFACVNSDDCEWLGEKHADGHFEILQLLSRDRKKVGTLIVTNPPGNKKLGKYDTITADYKYPEGTDENEKAWERAFSFVGLTDKKNRSKMQKSLIGRKNSDVNIKISLENQNVTVGEDIILKLQVKSSRALDLETLPTLTLNSTYQTGEIYKSIATAKMPMKMTKDADLEGWMTVKPEEYEHLFAADNLKLLRANAFFQFSNGSNIEIVSDRLDFSAKHATDGLFEISSKLDFVDISKSSTISFTVSLTNKMKKPLTNIEIDAKVRKNDLVHKTRMELLPGENFSFEMKLRFTKAGYNTVIGTLKCDQIEDLKAYKMIEIRDEAADKKQYFWL